MRVSLSKVVIISLVVFTLMSFFSISQGYNDQLNTLLAATSFIFGIFIAFSITTSQTKLNKINETLKEEEGIYLYIYKTSEVFGSRVKKEVQKLIDQYLIDQVDYLLPDFKYSNKSFLKLFEYINNLKPVNKREEVAYENLTAVMVDSVRNRKLVETLTQETLSKFEWLSIISLLSVILILIFSINDRSVISIISSILLSTSAVVLVAILRDLDNLRWKEQSWIWEPLEQLFNELELLPYYPKDLINQGRVKLDRGHKIRLVDYQNKYPDMTGKKIEIIQI